MVWGPELLVIAGIIVLLFGAKKLPELAKSIGQSKAAFNEGVAEGAPAVEDSGEDKVEGPLEEGGKGDIDGDGIPDSEDERPRVPDSGDDDEDDADGSGGDGDEENIHSSAQGGFG
ncbi:MAG: twin-arginine translocase TatA/TatE family subunit [Candidatus Poseidoniia archaeon]|jgi:sec-independent protein translocase protein TatA|nr:twin-arginine translocase TatA/TatE family subunit [Candidatus Poseidoniia archaeon]HJP44035.1 twin-arginine translocase TatA/TatE family subunit [Candidatus Poseidoniia archaeon]